MYPGTILNYIDNSKINTESEILLDTRSPLWMIASTFPKGPEKLTVTDATNFYELFGDTIDFDKYGQLNLQAKNIIDNGGRVLVKRLMPDEATLSNLYYTASVNPITVTTYTVTTVTKEATEEEPEETAEVECSRTSTEPYIYTRLDNGEVVVPKTGTTPVENTSTTGVKITWTKKSAENIKSYQELKEVIDAESDFVPFAFTDNGRGGSIIKSIRFTPDYNISRNLSTTFYNFEIYEGGTRKEYNTVTIDPDVIISNKPYRLYRDDYIQIDTYAYESKFDKFVDTIFNTLNPDPDNPTVTKKTIRSMDLLFGYTNKGEASDLIKVEYKDGDGNDAQPFNVNYGISLDYGLDGWYTEDEITAGNDLVYNHETNATIVDQMVSNYYYDQKLVDLMIKFYHGEIDDIIYDVDSYRLFGVADANLPFEVKQAITEYVVFRNDCFFFRDLCIVNDDNFSNILYRDSLLHDYNTTVAGTPKFNQTFMYADYCSTYEINDPETRKRERVTMMYDLVTCLTLAYINSPFSPNAGTYNGYVLESALPDSLNFIPMKTPRVNYKQAMDDSKINYAIYEEDNNLVVQSLYSKNNIYSQLSYINNVLAMQEIGRRVAMVCPSVRYSLQLSGDDVSNYTKLIAGVLERYSSSFDTLEFVYSGDSIHVNQKIFYGSIQFSFANWYQTEIFDLIANPTTVLANTDDEDQYI